MAATLSFFTWETGEAKPGTETIVWRLTDVIFVLVLRAWIESAARSGRRLDRGAARPPRGRCPRPIHRSPERDCTDALLGGVACRARASPRASRARRRAAAHLLSRWRLETPAGLLRDGVLGLGEIASRVGYESEAAFSKAFRRRFGAPPGAYRRSAAA